MTNVHIKLKNLRDENNYKQKQVAEYLGISQQAYSYYELDRRELPSKHAIALAKLYHVSTDYLLGVEPSRAGSYDLHASFIQNVTLEDVIINLKKLKRDNKEEMMRFLSYLIHAQANELKKRE